MFYYLSIMKALPNQQRALLKRSALIQAAIDEFSQLGFEAATAKSIAAKAEVATGTFYQYFDNKNDMLRVIATERYDKLHSQIKGYSLTAVTDSTASSIADNFETTLWFVYEFHKQAPELHQILEYRRGLDEKLEKVMRDSEAVLQSRVRQFVQSQSTSESVDIVANNLFAMAEGLIHKHVFGNSNNDISSTIKVGARMLASYFSAAKDS